MRETNTTLENIQLKENHSRLTEANNFRKAQHNAEISNQVALVNHQDKYLDIDQKIFSNYNKAIRDKGWAR